MRPAKINRRDKSNGWTSVSEAIPPLDNGKQCYSINVLVRLATEVVMEGYISHKTGVWYDENSVSIYGQVLAWKTI